MLFRSEHTHFIEFLLDEADSKPDVYPWLNRATGHVRRQRQMILDNIACLSPIEELGGALALTHEAVLAMMLDNPDAFYRDLAEVVRRFFARHDHPLDEKLLGEIIAYQRARMPLWGEQERRVLHFTRNVPAYFAALTKGLPTPDIVAEANAIEVVPRDIQAKDKGSFAVQRSRSGHTIILNDIRLMPSHAREGMVA